MEDDPDVRFAMVSMAVDYLAFLDDTGRWTGSAEDLMHCGEDLTRYLGQETPPVLTPDDIDIPPISPEQEFDGLSALTPVRQLHALLDWVGDGRPVTGTGVPRPALIGELTQALGVELTEGQRTVRTLRHLPALATLWDSAVSAGLITLTSTRAVRATEKPSLHAIRSVVTYIVRRYFEVDDPYGSFHAAKIVAAQIVLKSMTDNRPTAVQPENFANDYEPRHIRSWLRCFGSSSPMAG